MAATRVSFSIGCVLLIVASLVHGCTGMGCVRNSDCASNEQCMDVRCVPRGTESASSDGGAAKSSKLDAGTSTNMDAATLRD